LRARSRDAAAALLLLVGCAGGEDPVRRDLDALRGEIRALRQDNEELARRVDLLAARVEVATGKAKSASRDERAGVAAPAVPAAPIVPPDLAVVRIEPSRSPSAEAGKVHRAPRAPPPVPTAVPIAEPDPERLEQLGRRSGRDLGAEADDELARARKLSGPARARALEDFAARYPRHPSADNALVEASAAYADAGAVEAACGLARRARDDYPAGDAMSDALERLAWCESRRGATAAERRLLERLVTDYPRTPAADRAGARLATISGHAGEPPAAVPARSGP
jgi:TolA-binding protein